MRLPTELEIRLARLERNIQLVADRLELELEGPTADEYRAAVAVVMAWADK